MSCYIDCSLIHSLPHAGTDHEQVTEGDVQKKMMPWRAMIPEAELEADLVEEYSKKRQQSGGLVLVTSLIDKIPNLGGKAE